MAYTPCSQDIAANIVLNCAAPATPGLKSVALLIARKDIDTIAYNATNPNQITAFTLKADAKVAVIDNAVNNPFDGSIVELATDGLYPSYNKTINFKVPDYGGAVSKDIIEPLAKNTDGFVIIVQRRNQRGDGSFVVIGTENGAKVTTQANNMTDTATSGIWSVTVVETGASKAEVVFFDTDYQTTLADFNTLKGKSY
jgi:hypothetical protein